MMLNVLHDLLFDADSCDTDKEIPKVTLQTRIVIFYIPFITFSLAIYVGLRSY